MKQSVTTHESLQFMVILAQCFAMMPLDGVTKKDLNLLTFHWVSAKMFYTLMYLLLLLTDIILLLIQIIENGTALGSFVTILFFLCSFITTVLSIRIAKDWPSVMKKWEEIDCSMNFAYGFPNKLRFKLVWLTTVVMAAAALEHSLFLIYSLSNIPNVESTSDRLAIYFKTSFRHIFIYLPYSAYIGCIMQIINIFSTFTWNYMDLFIMLLSTSLAERFKQIAKRLSYATKCPLKKPASFWSEIREDYNKLSVLCKTLDASISDLVLLSFANNLFVIMIQLLNSLEPSDKHSLLERLYFIYSFSFLIARTVAVSLICARIDCESNKPIAIMYSLPDCFSNEEIDRLLMQLKSDPNALTGRQLFKVRKSLILSIAGAIVTYELIFIQFNIK